MADFWDISGLALAILGVLALFQLVWQRIFVYLPSELFKKLNDILDEAETIFKHAIEDGLQPPNAAELRKRLVVCRHEADTLLMKVYCAVTTREQIYEMLTGLSLSITLLVDRCSDLCADVMEAIELEKQKLEAEQKRAPVRRRLYVRPSRRRQYIPPKTYVTQPFSSFCVPDNYVEPTRPRTIC